MTIGVYAKLTGGARWISDRQLMILLLSRNPSWQPPLITWVDVSPAASHDIQVLHVMRCPPRCTEDWRIREKIRQVYIATHYRRSYRILSWRGEVKPLQLWDFVEWMTGCYATPTYPGVYWTPEMPAFDDKEQMVGNNIFKAGQWTRTDSWNDVDNADTGMRWMEAS